MIEDLGVVGALGQSVKPHADRLISVSFPDVEVGQSVSQSAGLGTRLQQRLAQSDAIIEPAANQGNNHQTMEAQLILEAAWFVSTGKAELSFLKCNAPSLICLLKREFCKIQPSDCWSERTQPLGPLKASLRISCTTDGCGGEKQTNKKTVLENYILFMSHLNKACFSLRLVFKRCSVASFCQNRK